MSRNSTARDLRKELDEAIRSGIYDLETQELISTYTSAVKINGEPAITQGEVIWQKYRFACPLVRMLSEKGYYPLTLAELEAERNDDVQRQSCCKRHRPNPIQELELGTRDAFSKYLRRKLWKQTTRKAELKRLNKNHGVWALRHQALAVSTPAPRVIAPTLQVSGNSRRVETQ